MVTKQPTDMKILPGDNKMLLGGSKQIAECWGVSDVSFQKAIKKFKPSNDPSVPAHIKEAAQKWLDDRLPRDKAGTYRVTVAQAKTFYRDHVQASGRQERDRASERDSLPPPRDERGRLMGNWTAEMLQHPERYLIPDWLEIHEDEGWKLPKGR